MMKQNEQSITGTPEYMADQFILAAGAWDETGQQDELLEQQAEGWLNSLQEALGVDRETALEFMFRMEVAA